jgi:hypothetical protein
MEFRGQGARNQIEIGYFSIGSNELVFVLDSDSSWKTIAGPTGQIKK